MNPENPQNRALTRRNMLALLGVVGANFLLGCKPQGYSLQKSTPANLACVVTPEQTEGPYFVDEKLNRSDIRQDPADGQIQQGLTLNLVLNVFAAGKDACLPIKGAIVDIWHCNAEGAYSDAQDRSFNTQGRKFLRGYQITDDQGRAQFTTIYPGWYEGRAVHIHFKIRTADSAGKSYEFTSQLYFDDALSDEVYAAPLYAKRGIRKTRNSNDFIFSEGGEQLILKPTRDGQGLKASFDVGLMIG